MLLTIDYLVYKKQPSSKRSDVPIKEGIMTVGSRT